jgi:hypothetical protein
MIYGTVPFNKKRFSKYLNKNTILLDYGCGTGIWDKNVPKKISKIFLYDKNHELYKLLRKKYSHNKKIFFLTKISKINKLKINTIIVNSVFQYIGRGEIVRLIKVFYKIKINKVFINDIPKYNRLIEVFYNIFNYSYITNILKYLFDSNY